MPTTVAALAQRLVRHTSVRRRALVPRRIAARHEGPVRRILTRAFHRVRRPLSPEQVQTAIRFQSEDMLLAALFPVTGQWMLATHGLVAHFRDIYFDSYTTTAHEIEHLRAASHQRSSYSAYIRAQVWAENYAGQLISEVTEENRSAIRDLIANAFQRGIPPRQLARLILQTTTLGLTRRGVMAVLNARTRLLAARPGQRVRIGAIVRTIPTGGFSVEQVEGILTRYSQQLLGERALTIARTETIQAAREGQQEQWREAREEGRLPRDWVQQWSAAPDERTCPICRALDGSTVPLEHTFVSITGVVLEGPPAHPNCRCSLVLAEREEGA